jgi:hypothetical protein
MNDQKEVGAEISPMTEETELRNDVRLSMKQIDEGHGISNRDAKAALRKRLAR